LSAGLSGLPEPSRESLVSQRDAVIVEAVRTPVGVGKPGKSLSGVHPGDLSAAVLEALVTRAGLDPALVDDVIWGCVSQVGEQGVNIARNAALAAGFPEEITGTTVDRQCGSSQQAVHFAAAGLIAGHYDVAIAGGVESMSRVPMFSNMVGGDGPFPPRMMQRYDGRLVPQGISAEMIAAQWGLSREQLDEIAFASHERAAAATDEGRFADQIVPIGEVSVDEGIRRGTTLEKLASLKPVFQEDGVVTAGNSSQLSDGSAALLLTTSDKARELGLTPIARIHTVALAGVDPVIMLTGPIPATAKALQRSGLALADIGAFEVNEAFASVVAAWLQDTGADPARTNPNGGAIALGHPLGGSGARLMTTLVHHMRQTGTRYGLQTMCEGGGMANATILELL
jgi:acetyl-CoA acyltransferase